MFGFIKKLFGSAPAEKTVEAPYKVETPIVEAPKVETATPVAEKATEAMVESVKPAPKKKAAPKKAAPKKEGVSKGRGRKPKSKA